MLNTKEIFEMMEFLIVFGVVVDSRYQVVKTYKIISTIIKNYIVLSLWSNNTRLTKLANK